MRSQHRGLAVRNTPHHTPHTTHHTQRTWLMMPGSMSVSCFVSFGPLTTYVLAAIEACTFGLEKCTTLPSLVKRLTSSMAGMLVTPSFFSVEPSFLSSEVAVWGR